MSEQLLDSVKSKYGAVAESTLSSDHAGVKAVAEAFGYSAEELTSIPAEANMGRRVAIPQQQLTSAQVRWSWTLVPAAVWTCSWLPRWSVRRDALSVST